MSSVECNTCRTKNGWKGVTEYVCFTCELSLCSWCSKVHRNHRCVQLNSEEYGQEIKRMWEEVKNETDKEEKFREETAEVFGTVKVRAELDRGDCHVTGICVLEPLVVCDKNNICIKLFDLRNYSLQRYISLDSPPYDVTEVDLRKSQSLSSDSTVSNKPGTTEQKTRNVIVVTFPQVHKIVFLDLNYHPAKKTKIIETEIPCFAIDSSSNKIWVAYMETRDIDERRYRRRWSVYIMSTDGDILHSFKSYAYGLYHQHPFEYRTLDYTHNPLCIALLPGRIYFTEPGSKKVVCKDLGGRTMSTVNLEIGCTGICTDKAGENVYMCTTSVGRYENSLYKLSSDLKQQKKMVDFNFDYRRETSPLCYYKDKLFVASSNPPFSRSNHVTGIRIL